MNDEEEKKKKKICFVQRFENAGHAEDRGARSIKREKWSLENNKHIKKKYRRKQKTWSKCKNAKKKEFDQHLLAKKCH
jgi:hypothetical protein